MSERIQKILSEAGVCSRRTAEKLIKEGHVKLNGFTAKLGDKADISVDSVTLDGAKISKSEKKVYIMLNKPRGYVTTLADEAGRKCVTELVSRLNTRVYPVGRLDMHSEGMLLMTNDGDLAYKLTHPKHEIYKKYLVRLTCDGGAPTELPEITLSKPIEIDGIKLLPAKCRLVERLAPDSFIITMAIREGKNRQIRRMCVACGYTVNSLKRVAVGELNLGDLRSGTFRELTAAEVDYLKNI